MTVPSFPPASRRAAGSLTRRGFSALTGGLLAAGIAGGARSAEADAVHAWAYRRTRRFADLPVGRVAYVERGQGPDAALFLHGFPLNSFQWRAVLKPLSGLRRCIAPDFLGLGYTEVAEGQAVGPAAQVDMLVALMDALGIGQADIVANDSGGAVAQRLTARHPGRVRTLLLTNCDTEIDSPPPALAPVIALAKTGAYPDQWLAPWLADKTLARSAQGLGGMCYADPRNPSDAALEMYLAPLVATPRRKALTNAYAIALEPNALSGTAQALRQSRMLTRVIWGEADTIFSPKGADYLAALFPDGLGLRRLPGAKLFWPEERPEVIIEEAGLLWRV